MSRVKSFLNYFKKKNYLEPTVEKILDRFIEIEDSGYILKTNAKSIGSDKFGYLGITILYKDNDHYGPIVQLNNNKILELFESSRLPNILNSLEKLYNVTYDGPHLMFTQDGKNWKNLNKLSISDLQKMSNEGGGIACITIHIGLKKDPYQALVVAGGPPF